jgi:hypothetical protein
LRTYPRSPRLPELAAMLFTAVRVLDVARARPVRLGLLAEPIERADLRH